MKDTHSYKGMMNSDYFWKRALGVIGNFFIGYILVLLMAFSLALIFILISNLF